MTTSVAIRSKKAFQNTLRALIVAGSLSGFLGGWALLAHAGKPVDGNAAAIDANLPPLNLQSLAPSGSPAGAFQPLQPLPSTSFSLPRLRTRGS